MQVGDRVRRGDKAGAVTLMEGDSHAHVQWDQGGRQQRWHVNRLVLEEDQQRFDRQPKAVADEIARQLAAADEHARERGWKAWVDVAPDFSARPDPVGGDLPAVDRVEVIDHRRGTDPFKARAFHAHEDDLDVAISLQDNGRTLKVFVKNREGGE